MPANVEIDPSGARHFAAISRVGWIRRGAISRGLLAALVLVAIAGAGGIGFYLWSKPPAVPTIAIGEAAKKGDVDAIEQHKAAGTDLNKRDASGWWPLLYAGEAGRPESIRALIGAGADPNQVDAKLSGAAHRAASASHNTALRVLIELGADPSVRGFNGMNVLNCASVGGNEEGMRLLVGRGGVDPNAVDADGRTSLILTIQHPSEITDNVTQCVQLLLDAKADPNIKDKSGKTALTYAVEQKKDKPSMQAVEKLLRDHGAKE